ncbi:hypothetical protein ACVW00_000051 [Marmoricola sp. URHA0025 HA25]
MSVMRDDRTGQPPDPHHNHETHLANLVGRRVAYEQGDIDPRHGTIVSANYSLSGEAVLIVHPDSRPSEVPANAVLMGRQATWALEHLDSPVPLLGVDQAARRRLNAEQTGTIPGAANTAPSPAVTR